MSQHHARIKNDPRWKAARRSTLVRDDYACTECGAQDVPLQVDHIIDLALIIDSDPLLAFDLDNLRTLCTDCHQAKGQTTELVRQPWVHDDYPELKDLVVGGGEPSL